MKWKNEVFRTELNANVDTRVWDKLSIDRGVTYMETGI